MAQFIAGTAGGKIRQSVPSAIEDTLSEAWEDVVEEPVEVSDCCTG